MREAYRLITMMRERKIVINPYLEHEMVLDIHKALNVPMVEDEPEEEDEDGVGERRRCDMYIYESSRYSLSLGHVLPFFAGRKTLGKQCSPTNNRFFESYLINKCVVFVCAACRWRRWMTRMTMTRGRPSPTDAPHHHRHTRSADETIGYDRQGQEGRK